MTTLISDGTVLERRTGGRSFELNNGGDLLFFFLLETRIWELLCDATEQDIRHAKAIAPKPFET